MRHKFVGSLCVLACLARLAAAPMPAQDDSVKWLNNYQAALRQAKQTHKPIFLEFRCEA
jgi:hypothetical protein